MSVDRSKILTALARLELPIGGDLVSNDFIRAVTIDGKSVRFVIEAPNCLLYTSPSPRDGLLSRMPSSA